MHSANSVAVAISLLVSLQRVTALPQIFHEQCATPTTTTTVTGRPIAVCDRIACIDPISVCSAGEPTGPAPPSAYTAAVTTAPDLCTVTVSLGVPFFCGGCASCTSEAVVASSTLYTPPPSPPTTTAPPTVVINPGGPMMSARQLPLPSAIDGDLPIIDHHPGGPVVSLITLTISLPVSISSVPVVKRDDPILSGHGGGPMITARDDPILSGHGGGPMITARDEIISNGHGGGPLVLATETPSP